MKLGIGSYTYTWAVGVAGHLPPTPMTAQGLVDRAAELGVRVVQFCDNLSLLSLARAELEEVVNAALGGGIALELGTRGIQEANLLAHLELARRLAAPFVRVVVDSPGDNPAPEEVVRRLQPVVAQFADAGVRLALENHDRFSARALVRVVEALGPAHVGICLDTVNSFGALEGPEVVVTTLARYALNLHVKDFTIQRVSSQMGFVVTGCAAGRGRLDVPWLLNQMPEGREVNAILELWTPFGTDLAATLACESRWAEESVDYLRRLIPG